ncbi:MAG TPA: FAD-dependent oxidoreductase [Thermoanaerobaculia bacterium]|jgi:thioredoxin reductase|nr:FAD-dependent oxidoreductase [Thermoanaerobaculia bacterium]
MPKPQIAILGSGPTGLEAALAAAERGLPFTLYEAAPTVAGHVRSWGHVRLFTPWSMNVSPRMRTALETAGISVPDEEGCPTGDEFADRVLEPIAALPSIAPNLRLSSRVVAIGREGLLKHEEISSEARAAQPFRLLVANGEGRERIERATVVIDTTGTYSNPNQLGDGGIPAPGELALDGEIRRRLPNFDQEADWAGKTILLVGGGHSAQTAARDLARLAEGAGAPGTRLIWAIRGAIPSCVADDHDALPERGRLLRDAADLAAGGSSAIEVKSGVAIESLRRSGEKIEVSLRSSTREETITVDRILSLTGFVPNDRLYRQLQIHECYAFSAPMKLSAALLGAAGGGGDCLVQTSHGADTLVNPEPNFYILGIKSYGRNTNFLMRVGWEQVGEVFGRIG